MRPIPGRLLEPFEAFEVTPWRALALFRIASLVYAVVLAVANFPRYEHWGAGWVVLGVMSVWSALAIAGYERPELRAWPLLLVDLAVTASCLLATRWVVGASPLEQG